MPEGHTIHRLARQLRRRFAGRRVAVSSPQGRFSQGAALLDGSLLEGTDAHGKHLFLGLDGQRWIHVHLGLYGRFVIGRQPAPEPRGALRLRLATEEDYADLRGPSACELVSGERKAGISARLGADPLRPDADPARAWARISRSRAPVAGLLMDQAVVAGVGNVFRAETLYRAGVAPLRAGATLEAETWDVIWADLRGLMRTGVRLGRIITTRPEHRARRSGPVRGEDTFYVYRRAGLPCRVCGTTVGSAPLLGRILYWCPTCQPTAGDPTTSLVATSAADVATSAADVATSAAVSIRAGWSQGRQDAGVL